MDKTAAVDSALARQILTGVAISLASSLAAYGAYEGIRGLSSQMRDRVNKATAWNKLRSEYPELGGEGEEGNRRIFDSIYQVAPSVARTPGIVIPLIRQAKEYSTGGLDASTLRSLADIQQSNTDTRSLPLSVMKLFTPGLTMKDLANIDTPTTTAITVPF